MQGVPQGLRRDICGTSRMIRESENLPQQKKCVSFEGEDSVFLAQALEGLGFFIEWDSD